MSRSKMHDGQVAQNDEESAVLLPIDESFNHQVAMPQAVASSSDPGWRERYWVNLQDVESKDCSMTLGIGRYPNQDVFEGFVCLSRGLTQTNLRLSRSISGHEFSNPYDLAVGPLRVEIVEPFKALRFVLEPNDSGIELDVLWTSVCDPILEERHLEIEKGRVKHDLVRYVQLGRAQGELISRQGAVTLDPTSWYGERDHSWGIRPMPPRPGGPPGSPPAWKFIMFCPLQFETFAAHIYLYEAEPGLPLHLSARLVGTNGHEDPPHVYSLSHDLEWEEGAPAATLLGGTLDFHLTDGSTLEATLTAHPQRVLLKGGGYGQDHGEWKGEAWAGTETWDLTDPDLLRRASGASSDHLVEATCAGERGFGVMEYVVRSGYPKYWTAQRKPTAAR